MALSWKGITLKNWSLWDVSQPSSYTDSQGRVYRWNDTIGAYELDEVTVTDTATTPAAIPKAAKNYTGVWIAAALLGMTVVLYLLFKAKR